MRFFRVTSKYKLKSSIYEFESFSVFDLYFFSQGVYANTTTARVDAVPDLLPDWLLSGKYWLRADAWDGLKRRHMACLQFDFNLS